MEITHTRQYVSLPVFLAALEENVSSRTGNGIQDNYSVDHNRKAVDIFIDRYTCDENGFSLGYERYVCTFKFIKGDKLWRNEKQEAVDPEAQFFLLLYDAPGASLAMSAKVHSLPCRPYKHYHRPDDYFVWEHCSALMAEVATTPARWEFDRESMAWSIKVEAAED